MYLRIEALSRPSHETLLVLFRFRADGQTRPTDRQSSSPLDPGVLKMVSALNPSCSSSSSSVTPPMVIDMPSFPLLQSFRPLSPLAFCFVLFFFFPFFSITPEKNGAPKAALSGAPAPENSPNMFLALLFIVCTITAKRRHMAKRKYSKGAGRESRERDTPSDQAMVWHDTTLHPGKW